MLAKLIKYDIRSTWRDFAGVYLAILLGAVFFPILFVYVNNTVTNAVAGLAITGIVIATVVFTIIMLFKIFNTNVFSKEGYLTMTLPVSGTEIVASKLIVSTMWIVLTGLVATLGIFVFIFNIAPMADIIPALKKAFSMLGAREIFAIALILIAMVVSTVKEIAKLFLACSVAHLKLLGRFRILAGIVSFFVFSWLEIKLLQAVNFIAGLIPGVDEYVHQLRFQVDIQRPEDIMQLTGLFNQAMALWILYSLVLTVIFSIGVIWILNRKLDLD